ncbi:hypothetical protein M2459_001094 [Parabacteroides sp. PF5-5]|nr:hypothetical protein [Parabacteroides sp. PH5-39]MDH6315486.1 hypothetical protein [Parabacteroides sp. PF5-13]MDH6319020.1 hypothetical protein [Parabacteroides sp. PH5-13]MDH6322750.1 hypothetical protein [Parabacteroides sp. PH5-8]MDH6326678.1 hypothetical protein [Parabacteroides sp. PH5-41]MDH6334352.1 hypothetical protein [Parabacteroides sp. PF5-5]MDH6345543.1 hypothetical protein [Parabacteroides sp. PH5-46]MDH6360499.1 hypothetical protein [Parabacteroides sp. PH5-16]MDH6376040.
MCSTIETQCKATASAKVKTAAIAHALARNYQLKRGN